MTYGDQTLMATAKKVTLVEVNDGDARLINEMVATALDGVIIATSRGRVCGVLMSTEEFEFLRAQANLVSEPDRLFAMISEAENNTMDIVDLEPAILRR
jgi:hypothetical protein